MTDDECRDLYDRYIARRDRLLVLRQYARDVIAATGGASMTQVEPLASMNHGGPLLCDVCGKPMILEGGGYQGMHADKGWARNPVPGWKSYISGGMLLLTESNGTLRVYRGHPHGDGCVGVGDRANDERRAAFRATQDTDAAYATLDRLAEYLRDKAPAPVATMDAVLSDVYKTMLTYDPGDGINAP